MHRGEAVRLFFSSADASTAAAISIYDINGVARPLASGERLVILSLAVIFGSTSGEGDLFDDVNDDGNVDDGETLWHIGDGYSTMQFEGEGQFGGPGRTPKIKTGNAVAVELSGNGYVIKA